MRIRAGVVVLLLALVTACGHGSGSTRPTGPARPSPRPTGWLQSVPASFPLSAGFPGSGRPAPGRPTKADFVPVCKEFAWPLTGSVDASTIDSVSESDTEGGGRRTLALYADDAAARKALAELRAAVTACPASDPSVNWPALAVLPVDLGTEQSFTWAVPMETGLYAMDFVIEVARTGNALFFASSHAPAGSKSVLEHAAERLRQQSAAPLSRMCTFYRAGC